MDGKPMEFTISQDAYVITDDDIYRVRNLFGVLLDRLSSTKLTALASHSDNKNTVWMQIKPLSTGPRSQANCAAAKKYVLSLTSAMIFYTQQYAPSVYQKLVAKRDDIERQSSASLVFRDTEKAIGIKYVDNSHLELTKSLIDTYRQNTDWSNSTRLDSCDSSYGSTFAVSSEFFSDDLKTVHGDDKSRVLSNESSSFSSSHTRTDSPDSELVSSIPNYATKLEFALKRGYSKDQLKQALKKCGGSVSQNDLLSELISIGSLSSSSDETQVDSVIEEDGTRLTSSFLEEDESSNLKPIVIDGSNVAMSHGNKEVFSCKGIKIVVDWFKARGHQNINAFVPQWRKESQRPITPITDQDLLTQLEKEGVLTFTPSRRINGKRVVCYDDRYIIKLASETNAIVVSNDNYRDLLNESPEYKKVIDERLLMYCFVQDHFMPPDDPLGRNGPSLENFLRKEPTVPGPVPAPCPYGRKCTYGNKCKFFHPERGLKPQKSVTESIQEVSRQRLQEICEKDAKKLVTKVETGGKQMMNSKRLAARTITQVNSIPDYNRQSVPPPLPPRSHENPPLSQSTPHVRSAECLLDQQETMSKAFTGSRRGPALKVSVSGNEKTNGHLLHHWNSDLHDTLRPTNSDPNLLFSGIDDGGHLALAKKLSDEGCQVPSSAQVTLRAKGMSSPKPFDTGDISNIHRKLQRQLTLKGSEDPRVKQHYPDVQSQPHLQSQLGHRQFQESTSFPFSDSFLSHSNSFSSNNFSSLPEKLHPNAANKAPGFDRHSLQSPVEMRNSWPDTARQQRHTQSHILSQHGGLSPLVGRGTLPYPETDQNSRGTWPSNSLNNAYQQHRPFSPYQHEFYHQDMSGASSPVILQQFYRQTHPTPPVQQQQQHQQQHHQHQHQHQQQYSPETYPVTYSPFAPPFASSSSPQPPSLPPRAVTRVQPPGFDDGAPILPQDPRYNMYYYLIGLFAEEKVRKVMNRYPEERNPQQICAHILNM